MEQQSSQEKSFAALVNAVERVHYRTGRIRRGEGSALSTDELCLNITVPTKMTCLLLPTYMFQVRQNQNVVVGEGQTFIVLRGLEHAEERLLYLGTVPSHGTFKTLITQVRYRYLVK